MKNKIRNAAVKYIKLMEKIKRRICKISTRFDSDNLEDWEDEVRKLSFEMKHILEMLPYSYLGLREPEIGDNFKQYRGVKAIKLIRPDKEDFPKLLQKPFGKQEPFILLDPQLPRDDYLNNEKWQSALAWCNRFAHARNPAGDLPELDIGDLSRERKSGIRFAQRIVNLLNTHSVMIIAKDLDLHGIVLMSGVQNYPGVVMKVIARQTPWLSQIQSKEGTLTLRRQNEAGEWEDVVNSEDGAISIHAVIGYCTKNSVFSKDGIRI